MVQDQIAQRQKTQDLERRLQERDERYLILETSSTFLAAKETALSGSKWPHVPDKQK